MRTEQDIINEQTKLRNQIELLDRVAKFKKDLEEREFRGWECIDICRENNRWIFSYQCKLSLCGNEICDKREAIMLL